jgi:hypothetical protein
VRRRFAGGALPAKRRVPRAAPKDPATSPALRLASPAL